MSCVLFSVSDPRFRQPASLYDGLEEETAATHLAPAFSFAGSPFSGLPHPALCDCSDRESLLRDGWERLAAFCAEFVTPALDAGKRVVTDGFDLDLLLSVAAGASEEEREELEAFHDAQIGAQLYPRRLLPQYFLFSGNARQEICEMQDAHPELRAHDDEALHELVVAMNDLRARYFLGRPDKGMRPFFFAYPHEGSTVQMWSVLNAHYVKQLAAAA